MSREIIKYASKFNLIFGTSYYFAIFFCSNEVSKCFEVGVVSDLNILENSRWVWLVSLYCIGVFGLPFLFYMPKDGCGNV